MVLPELLKFLGEYDNDFFTCVDNLISSITIPIKEAIARFHEEYDDLRQLRSNMKLTDVPV